MMGVKFSEWSERQKARETVAQAELRRRLETEFAFGLHLLERRRALGLTRGEMAKILGISRTEVRRIERGGGMNETSRLDMRA